MRMSTVGKSNGRARGWATLQIVCGVLTLLGMLLPAQMRFGAALQGDLPTTTPAGATSEPATSTSVSQAQTSASATTQQGAPRIIVARLNDEIINPVTAHYLTEAIARGERENAPVVFELDTPGGLLQSTREIVKAIYASRVPVITYVYPDGSRAASAGVFITLASHVAAMAPTTHIGAAHPVDIGGKWSSPPTRDKDSSSSSSQEETTPSRTKNPFLPDSDGGGQGSDSVMGEKVMNDTLAWVEGIARSRGRNVEWAKDAVSKSISTTAEEAKRKGVVDIVAVDERDLLRQLDGRTVAVAGGSFTLHTAKASVEYMELTTRQRILNVLANPNVAYILLLLGIIGLGYELTHPGLIAPGVAGFISLLLAAFALQMLPTNYAALLLILVGIILIIAEIKFVSYGLLTLGGAVCLFFGSLALFDQPGPFLGVSPQIVVPVVLSAVALLGLLVILVIRSHHRRPLVGETSFAGQTAEVIQALAPEGKVFFNGTYWNAQSTTPVRRGAKVRIVGIKGLCLLVEPEEEGA